RRTCGRASRPTRRSSPPDGSWSRWRRDRRARTADAVPRTAKAGRSRRASVTSELKRVLFRRTVVELSEVDVYNPDNFVHGVPHEMFATLRREAPVYQHPLPDGKSFWCVTRHDDLVAVNRDSKTFSSWLGG